MAEHLFFQIGCGNSANYASLVKNDWADHFNLPGIPEDTKWQGVLVDAQPHSVIKLVRNFGNNPQLTVINAGVTGMAQFSMFETRDFTKVDQEARFTDARRYNDKKRPDFQPAFYSRTITLNQLFEIDKCFDSTPLENNQFFRNPVGLLALDVQGSEVDIFLNYNWSVKPYYIDIEPHCRSAEEIISEILSSQGYIYVRRRPDGTRRVNHLWRRSD